MAEYVPFVGIIVAPTIEHCTAQSQVAKGMVKAAWPSSYAYRAPRGQRVQSNAVLTTFIARDHRASVCARRPPVAGRGASAPKWALLETIPVGVQVTSSRFKQSCRWEGRAGEADVLRRVGGSSGACATSRGTPWAEIIGVGSARHCIHRTVVTAGHKSNTFHDRSEVRRRERGALPIHKGLSD